jgi:hypothetical protein
MNQIEQGDNRPFISDTICGCPVKIYFCGKASEKPKTNNDRDIHHGLGKQNSGTIGKYDRGV